MARVAVVLSGCGYLDGAEIQEAVFTLLFLDRAGAEVSCFAPDKEQMHVVDHRSGDVTGDKRNVLTESARIARGKIEDLKHAKMADFDALVMPGGFGAAKNLSNFAVAAADADVDPELLRVIGEAVKDDKPIVAICISPAVLAAALKKVGSEATLTIGHDAGTAGAIEKLGSHHQDCPVDRMVVDEEHRVISTPAYMLGPGPKGVAAGIEQSIDQLMRWLG